MNTARTTLTRYKCSIAAPKWLGKGSAVGPNRSLHLLHYLNTNSRTRVGWSGESSPYTRPIIEMMVIGHRQALQLEPRAVSPTWVGDDSLENITLDPELAKIAQEARTKRPEEKRGGGPEEVLIKVKWQPHPKDDAAHAPVPWGFKMKRVRVPFGCGFLCLIGLDSIMTLSNCLRNVPIWLVCSLKASL